MSLLVSSFKRILKKYENNTVICLKSDDLKNITEKKKLIYLKIAID